MEEKERYEELFLDLMLYETGIFTLYGDKPITVSLLEQSFAEKNPLYIDRTKKTKYSLIESWDLWVEKFATFNSSKFLFAKKEIPEMKGVYNAFFVNVPATVAILEKYYHEFTKLIGRDFDPKTVVYEISAEKSAFWDKAFELESHMTKGLLHGFEWENSKEFTALKPDEMKGRLSNILLPYEEISVENFNIPFFRYFKEHDPIVEKYKKQRQEIHGFFRGKTLFEGTMELLKDRS